MCENQQTRLKGQQRFYLAILLSCLMSVTSLNAVANHDLNQDFEGKVIGGYDAVAYFTMGMAIEGLDDISTEYLGGTWNFINQEHRDLFLADPGKYIPQYGGYCSVSSSFERHGGADPRSWQIVDDKLYLFFNDATSDGWDIGYSSTEAADKKWEKAKAGLLAQ